MAIRVEFSQPKKSKPGKGSAGLPTQIGGVPTTVSGIMEASKAIGNNSYVKKAKG